MATQKTEKSGGIGEHFDLLDLCGVFGALFIVAGLFIWFGPGPAMTVLGLFLVVFTMVVGYVTDKAKASEKTGG